MSERVYLDWNATAPLRHEARAAMLAAMDAVGNPSSVHVEGRAARAIVERARAQVAALIDADPGRVVFTSGATEANDMGVGGLGLRSGATMAACSEVEHASILEPAEKLGRFHKLPVTSQGLIDRTALDPGADADRALRDLPGRSVVAASLANSETGVVEDVDDLFRRAWAIGVRGHCDVTQAAGRMAARISGPGAASMALSAHKLGGPKGVGAFVTSGEGGPEAAFAPKRLYGGGQERGWRGGTENVVGVAGFGAAAEAAKRDLESGVWERVEKLRDRLEERISDASGRTIFVGAGAARLPNTSCFATPGWRGETQVMALDLAGFAVSAGSACSSGKVGPSRALRAIGLDEETARSAIRVSFGPTTTEQDIDRFAEAWAGLCERRRPRAA